MRFSGKVAARVGALGIAVAAIAIPTTAAHAVTGPAITVTPDGTGDTGPLANGQQVTVNGTGFTDLNHAVSIVECSSTGIPTAADCDVTNVGGGMTDGSGNFSATFNVKTGPIGSGTCPSSNGGACYIVASADGGGADSALAPITFMPVIAATPSNNVKSGTVVKVSGYGFPANKAPVAIVTCKSLTDASACDQNDASLTGATDGNGTFSNVKLTVASKADGGVCVAGKPCYVVATTDLVGMGSDPTQVGVTVISLKAQAAPAATATSASFSKKTDSIKGKVTSGGKGIKGLKTELDKKKGSHWKQVDTAKTGKGGKYHYKHVKNGTYRVETHATSKYKASKSGKVKVHI